MKTQKRLKREGKEKKVRRQGEGGLERGWGEKTGKRSEEEREKGSGKRAEISPSLGSMEIPQSLGYPGPPGLR